MTASLSATHLPNFTTKPMLFSSNTLRCLLLLLAVLILTPLPGIALERPAFAFTAFLETESPIHLGEPIVLDLFLTNLTSHRLAVMDGQQQWLDDPIERQSYRPGWYGLSLKDEQAKVVANEACINPQLMQFASPYPSIGFFDPNDRQTTYCPVSRLLNITSPGNYILTVDTYLPYADAPPVGTDPVTVIKNGCCVFTSSVSFAITVLPFDASHARFVANALCRKIQDIQFDQPHVIALADALFGMPEAVAYHSWQDLASNHRGNLRRDQSIASVELARLNTARSADILAGIVFNASLPREDRQNTTAYLLQQMYNRGNPALRKYIRSLYYYHGVTEIPDQFPKFGTIN